MTTATIPAAQTRLIETLRLQEERYGDAATLIERLSGATSLSDPACQKDLITLQQMLSAIRAAGNDVDRARTDYESDHHPRSLHLTEVLKQQEKKLSVLLEKVSRLTESFSASKEQIQDRLDSTATRQSMHKAYQQSMKTG